MRNPRFFIVGCPRSGTTLVERIANAHPQLAVVHETHWITRFYKKRIGLTRDGFVTPELLARLKEHRRFPHFHMPPDDLDRLAPAGRRTSFRDFVSSLYDQYGRREGKPVVGDKTTGGYLRNLDVLHALWPEARFVHVVRDGRDVCLSMLNWPKAHRAAGRLPMWEEDPVATTALWWRWHVRSGCRAGRRLGPTRYRELAYESFVRDPAEGCAALCAFLEVPFDESMLRFNAERLAPDPAGLSANQAWLPPTPGLRDWRTQMAPADVEMFEALAGDALDELEYERAYPTTAVATAARAEERRRSWEAGR